MFLNSELKRLKLKRSPCLFSRISSPSAPTSTPRSLSWTSTASRGTSPGYCSLLLPAQQRQTHAVLWADLHDSDNKEALCPSGRYPLLQASLLHHCSSGSFCPILPVPQRFFFFFIISRLVQPPQGGELQHKGGLCAPSSLLATHQAQ